MIYGNILSQPNDSEREIAKSNLEKMAKILLSAPVRHHKYVLTLVNRIKAIFLETLNTDLILNVTPLEDEDKEVKKEEVIQPPQITVQQSVQPIPLTNQFVQRNPIFNVLDVASASSAFDMHKTSNFSEDMHFSDFVYTPTLLDYNSNPNNNTVIIPHVMESNAFGKKPDYAASSPYNQYNYNTYKNNDTPNSNHSSTSPNLQQQQQQRFSTPPTSWISMDTPIPSGSSANPIMLNNPTHERSQQPYMGLPFDGRQLPKSNHPPPPSPSSNLSQTQKHYFNNDHNYGSGGPYY